MLRTYLRELTAHPLSLIGVAIVVCLAILAVLAPILAPPTAEDPYIIPYDGPASRIYAPSPTLPGPGHPFGTLEGYDLYYGCIWGIRMAFYMGILTTLAAAAIGLCIGSVAGYFEGMIDEVLMRFTDAFFAIPGIVYVLLVVMVLPLEWELNLGVLSLTITLSNVDRIILTLVTIGWPSYARLIRGEIKKVKHEDFVEAAVATGCSPLRVLRRHILPNSIGPLLAFAFMNVGGVLLIASTVGFLGFGPGAGYAEWGSIIGSSYSYLIFTTGATLQYASLLFIPAAFLSAFIIGWSLMGDSITYLIDPTLRRRRQY